MKIDKLRIRGEEVPSTASTELEHFDEPKVFLISGLTRGDQPPVEITLNDTDVVEFHFDDGTFG